MSRIDDASRPLSRINGFTLIEIMIVIVIIGILAALAMPRFMQAATKSKQSEAKVLLKQIYTMQEAYRQQNDTYALNGADTDNSTPAAYAIIGVELSPPARYTYHMVSDRNTFTCTATANLDDDATNDVWTIDQNGILTNTSNDVIN